MVGIGFDDLAIAGLAIVLCLCVCGCGDEGLLLDDPVLFAPSLMGGATEIPMDLQNLLWGNRDNLFASLAIAMEAGDSERSSFLIRRIHLRDMQSEYYTKHIDAGGIAIVGNSDVSDWYFEAARDVVLIMTSKHPRLREVLSPDYLHRFQWAQTWIEEGTLTGPRQILVQGNTLCGMASAFVPEARGRMQGGGWCSGNYCISSVYAPSDQRHAPRPMSVFVHEFAHAIDDAMPLLENPDMSYQDFVIQQNSDFDLHLERIYKVAKAQGIWKGEYAELTVQEYWAEGTVMWFYDIGPGRPFETYEAFFERDPLLAELLSEWFPAVALPRHY